MANRKRNIQMKFYVTEEEKRLIDEKMAQLPTRRYFSFWNSAIFASRVASRDKVGVWTRPTFRVR